MLRLYSTGSTMITQPGSFPHEKNHQDAPNRSKSDWTKHQTSSPVSIHHPNTSQKNHPQHERTKVGKITEIPLDISFYFPTLPWDIRKFHDHLRTEARTTPRLNNNCARHTSPPGGTVYAWCMGQVPGLLLILHDYPMFQYNVYVPQQSQIPWYKPVYVY